MVQPRGARLRGIGRWVLLLGVASFGSLPGCGGSTDEAPPPVAHAIDVELVQLDYLEFGGFEAVDTPFGGAFCELDAPAGLLLVNLWAELGPTLHRSIVNFPVVACGGPRRVFFAIDLRPFQDHLGREALVELRCAAFLSTRPLAEAPADLALRATAVASHPIRFASGIQGVELEPPGVRQLPQAAEARARLAVVPLIDTMFEAETACHSWFPNQECGLAECAPAAVSNSLKFLGAGDGENDIADCKLFTDFGPSGSDYGWPLAKRDATSGPPYGVTTTILEGWAAGPERDFPAVLEALRAGHDVEVNGDTHVAAVVAAAIIQVPGGPLYELQVAHDVDQGAPGGTVVEAIFYDTEARAWAGGTPGFFEGSQHVRFVIESKP